MKNFILLVLSLVFIVNTTSADDNKEMYIIGNAVDMQFRFPGDQAMEKQEDGTFKWKGFLVGNTVIENSRFKFTAQRDWHPSLTCQFETKGHTVINPGEEYQLYVKSGDDVGEDNAFQVVLSGIYEITIDPVTLTMTCTKEKEADDLYLVGDGTKKGWTTSTNDIYKMIREEEGIYTWTGEFFGLEGNNGRFKFLFGDSWVHSLTCNIRTGVDQHVVVEPGEMYELYPRQTEHDGFDNAFMISSTGVYTVTLDLNAMKLSCVEETIDLNNLYLVGNAPSGVWDNGKAIPMNRLSEGIFEWTGYLAAFDDKGDSGEFKFLSDKQSWDTGFNPIEGEKEIITGTTYDLNYRVNTKNSIDHKFLITTSGAYTITVDLNERTMFIETAEITRTVEQEAYGTICLPMDATAENAIIYEVAGVNSKDNPSVLYLKEVDNNKMLAGVPYIFQATEEGTITFNHTGDNFAFEPQTTNGLVGTYERRQVPADADNYVLSVGYKWYLVDNEFYCGANRAYLDLTAASVYQEAPNNTRAMNFNGNDGVTGIADIEAENTMVDVYTIQGIKVRSQVKAGEAKEGLLKGIYIINGKKEIVM